MMTSKTMKHSYLYGRQPARTESAAGVKGVLIRSPNGSVAFRVYHKNKQFTDYEIRHDDLSITINEDELAAFYTIGEDNILDHSPDVLGLRRLED